MFVLKISFDETEIEAILLTESAPLSVQFFSTLAKKGFYDGLKIYKSIPYYFVQTGCPLNTGFGFNRESIKLELTGSEQHHKLGSFSFANIGKNTSSSHFFICTGKRTYHEYDKSHTVFAQTRKSSLKKLEDLTKGMAITRISIEEVGDEEKVLEM